MQQFEIILKNNKQRSYHTIAIINLVLNTLVFIFLSFYDLFRPVALTSVLAIGLYVLLRWYVVKKQPASPFFDEFVFIIPAMCWFGFGNYLLMGVLVVLGILYRLSIQKIQFVFTRSSVVKTNFPKKTFEWNSFSNVVLRDNILTMDFKNNHLIQSEIEHPESIDQRDFNEFAQSKINKEQNILN
jgi:hypothetical protein